MLTHEQERDRAAQRLRSALNPQTAAEHKWTDWLLTNLIPLEADLWAEMVERRARTARRSGQMQVARHVLDSEHWDVGYDAHAREVLEHIASGAEDADDDDGVAALARKALETGDLP